MIRVGAVMMTVGRKLRIRFQWERILYNRSLSEPDRKI